MINEGKEQSFKMSVKSDVTGTGNVELGDKSISYRYREIHRSHIERGILLTIVSTRGNVNIRPSSKEYIITPQIHKDTYYEKHTGECYQIVAKAAMQSVIDANTWLAEINVRNRHFDQDYTLS